MKRIVLLFLVSLLFSCNTYFDIERKYMYEKTHNNAQFISKFKKDAKDLIESYAYKDHQDGDSIYNWYKIGNLYYIYDWRCTIKKTEYKHRKRSTKYMDDVFFEETSLLMIYNPEKGTVQLFDSLFFYKTKSHLFYETYNFFYLPTIVYGCPEFCEEPPYDYISGVLMVTKMNIEKPFQSRYTNEEVIYVNEDQGNLRIVTTKVKPKVFFMDYLLHQFVVHQSIGKFVSTDEFVEYIYDNDLKLISKKILDDFEYK